MESNNWIQQGSEMELTVVDDQGNTLIPKKKAPTLEELGAKNNTGKSSCRN